MLISAQRQDHLLELDGFFQSPETAPPSRLCMIRTYLDESGHESQHVIVAGHAGTETAWMNFAREWPLALGRQRTRLHMVKLRWNKQYTQRLLANLGPVPNHCGLVRVIGGVNVADYEDLVSGTHLEKFFKGYMPAMFSAVVGLLIQIPKDERAEIVLEQQDEYMPYAHAAMVAISRLQDKRLYRTDGAHKLSRWAFMSKGNEPLFDQADYLAYALMQRCRDPKSLKAQWSSPILQGGQTCGEILAREQARESLTKTPQFAKLLNQPT
jgi:hypothetical protein